MQRAIATLPESMSELCLLRLGIQTKGLRALLYAARLARAIDHAAAEAIASDAGLLHSERFRLARNHFGVLQYWRSFDALEAWSHREPHAEWWRRAVERIRTRGDFGIYHETFLVPRLGIEAIYLGFAPAGLGTFGTIGAPVGPMTTSRARLGRLRQSTGQEVD